jgi:adenosine deaminase
MKRNRGGGVTSGHHPAAVRGATSPLEYPQVRCGLILMMTERSSPAERDRGREGDPLGLAGRGRRRHRRAPSGGGRYDYTQIKPMVETAREAGLGVTIHVGEEGETGAEELGEVIENLRPDRIGHGILAAHDPELMRLLREAGTVLEICPTSNLLTKALANEDAVRDTFRTFVENGVAFTIATDGPEMMHTHLRDEIELLERIGALTREELEAANQRGHEASFIPR